jgi:RNA polymerase sigma-70 factor (ECF subfamily)
MSDASPSSVLLQGCLDRLRAGDPAAREQLFRHAVGRLERLARKMLHKFPGVQRWAQTEDVLQNALVRLLRALGEVQPLSVREFFALSAEQIRRELIDLARHHYGPEGDGAHHASQAGRNPDLAPAHEQPDLTFEPALLEGWADFHRQVQSLPEPQREAVDLLFYQELPQAEAAELLGVSVRTLQRYWQSALLKLHEKLGGHWPGM